MTISFRERATQISFLLPAVAILLTTSVYPLIYSFRISFYQWYMSRPGSQPTFVNVQNYIDLFRDDAFTQAIGHSLIYSFTAVGSELVLGMAVALLLTRETRLVTVARSIVLIPIMITPVVIGLLWKMLFNYTYGIINFFLTALGLPAQRWLAEPSTALFATILVDVWHWTPMIAIVLLAGLKSLPPEPFEAARVDGASSWQVFWKITLPLIRPVAIVITLIRFMDSFKTFDTLWMLTQGGPGNATEILSTFIYRTGLNFFNIGYAAAASWVLLVFVFAISIIFIRRVLRAE